MLRQAIGLLRFWWRCLLHEQSNTLSQMSLSEMLQQGMLPQWLYQPGVISKESQTEGDERKLIAETNEYGKERQLWSLEKNGVTEYEMVVNGVFVMSSYYSDTEIQMVHRAIELSGYTKGDILIGGLGMGFSVKEACVNESTPRSIDVVEIDPLVFEWNLNLMDRNRTYLADPRVNLIQSDFIEYIKKTKKRYHAICMDIDNGPQLLIYENNDYAYSHSFFNKVRKTLYDGGVFAIWSSDEDARMQKDMRTVFHECKVEEAIQEMEDRQIRYYIYYGIR